MGLTRLHRAMSSTPTAAGGTGTAGTGTPQTGLRPPATASTSSAELARQYQEKLQFVNSSVNLKPLRAQASREECEAWLNRLEDVISASGARSWFESTDTSSQGQATAYLKLRDGLDYSLSQRFPRTEYTTAGD